MASTFDDAVLDFDLNFLSQTSKPIGGANIPNKAEKQRKSIFLAKKKTIATDSLIRRYYEKKEILDQTERDLAATKDECRQVCVDFKNLTEKYGNLEQLTQQLQNSNEELQTQYNSTQNQNEALQSYVSQLQALVQDFENQIDTLKQEHKLELKTLEKRNKFSAHKNVNDMLKRHILLFIEVAVGKIKLSDISKDILKKYEDIINKSVAGAKAEFKGNEVTVDNVSQSIFSPQEELLKEKETALLGILEFKAGNGKSIKMPESDHDLDEVVSSGRGSSLAFSESDKCFQSPEYYMQESPVSHSVQVKQVSVGTSPITVLETVSRAVSPIVFENYVSLPMLCNEDEKTTCGSKHSPLTDKAVQVCFDIPNTVLKTIAPETIVPEIIAAKTIAVKTIVPETIEPEIIAPETIAAETIAPEAIAPDIIASKTIVPEAIAPETIAAETIAPETNTIAESSIMLIDSDSTIIRNKITVNSISPPMISEALPSPVEFADPIEYDDDDDLEENNKTNDPLINNINIPRIESESNKISQERKCLERNNSQMCIDNDSDNEVERIIGLMKWKQFKMITPIPATPVTNEGSNDVTKNTTNTVLSEQKRHTCQESVKIREETKVLHAGIAHLAREISSIKNMLQKLPDIIALTPEAVESDHDLYINKQMHLPKAGYNTPTPCSPVQSEVVSYAEDSPSSSKIDKSLEIPSQPTLIIEEDNQDTPIAEVNDTPTIHNRLQFEGDISIEDCHDLRNDDETENSDDTGQDLITCNYDNTITNSPENKKCKKPREKLKKLSKLEKIRRRLVPKGKISGLPPLSKIKKDKIVNKKLIYNPKKLITESDNSSTLNDKLVYEKALKVMTDLKSKQMKQLTPKKKPVLHTEIEKSETDSIVKTSNPNNVVLKSPLAPSTNKHNINNLFEPINSNSPNKRPRRKSAISPEDKVESDNPDNSHDEIEYNTPIKSIRRTLKRAAEVENEEEHEERNTRVLRSSVRHLHSKESKENVKESISSIPLPEKKRKISVNTNKILDAEMEPSSHTLDCCNKKQAKVLIEKMKVIFEDSISNRNTVNKPASPSFKSDQNIESLILKNTNSMKTDSQKNSSNENECTRCIHPKDSILCRMIEQHANNSGKRSRKKADAVSTLICNKINESVAKIIDLPMDKSKLAMDKLVVELRKWKLSNFLSGLIKYLKNPDRKTELFYKITITPAPPMTKAEQIILYIILELNKTSFWKCNVIHSVLDSIEFTLFQLNQTPEFDTIESMSHFYAVLCRYIKDKSRLRLFVMNAMYCLQFKSIPLIRQSIEVWMHIIPISSMDLAKSPLVMVIVYLLHFYKCEDRYNRVSEIRKLLQKMYCFNFTDWNNHKIFEMLRLSIKHMRDIPIERKMMRLALIIIAKRLGVRWCQENMIKKLILPFIEKGVVSEKTREFCVSMIGPLLKPYPAEMRVHCEISVNQLLDMLDQNPSATMEEAIFTSLIYISKHNPVSITKALTTWSPQKVSTQFEDLLKDFIQAKPVKRWKVELSKLSID